MIGLLRPAAAYALATLAALLAIATSEALLQSGHTLYLSFEPAAYLRQWPSLLLILLGMALLGAIAEPRPRLRNWGRGLLLMLLLVGVYQIARRSIDAPWISSSVAKLSVLGGSLLITGLVCRRWQATRQRRLIEALSLSLMAMFLLQPGMAGWLRELAAPAPRPAAVETSTQPTRRTVVLLLDEWDEQISEREGFFESPFMQELLSQSYRATQAVPAGLNTLVSVPGMLRGERFVKVNHGGVGYLVNVQGERFDADSGHLFGDLAAAGVPTAVVGFYHDYCRLAPLARQCSSEVLHVFPGWWSAMNRPLRQVRELDDEDSAFMRDWRASYRLLQARALAAARDPANRFVWMHLNVPHPPGVLNEGARHELLGDYRSNLQAAARLIEQLVQALRAGGEPTTLVLVSDHWLREKEFWRGVYERQRSSGLGRAGKLDDQRVPFIVWFSDAPDSAVVDAAPRSTTTLRALAMALVRGEVRSPTQTQALLARLPQDTRPIPPSDRARIHAGDGHHD